MLIAEADDPSDAMNEIARAAEQGGLIDISTLPRRTAPWVFVLDLLIENPVASDWMTCRLESMKSPADFEDIHDVAGHLL